MKPRYSPPLECFVHRSVEVRASAIAGRGLFAVAPISRGSIVARLGGRLVSRAELLTMFAAAANDPARPYIDTLSIDDGIDLVLAPNQPIHFCNHSCDPNVWHRDAFTLTARRAIKIGDELTVDYGTQSDGDFSMTCRCGSAPCRRIVSGCDWQRRELQARYRDHWVPILLARIRVAARSGR